MSFILMFPALILFVFLAPIAGMGFLSICMNRYFIVLFPLEVIAALAIVSLIGCIAAPFVIVFLLAAYEIARFLLMVRRG